MQYLEDEARKGFVVILVILSVIFLSGLVLSSMIDFKDDDSYELHVVSSQ